MLTRGVGVDYQRRRGVYVLQISIVDPNCVAKSTSKCARFRQIHVFVKEVFFLYFFSVFATFIDHSHKTNDCVLMLCIYLSPILIHKSLFVPSLVHHTMAVFCYGRLCSLVASQHILYDTILIPPTSILLL